MHPIFVRALRIKSFVNSSLSLFFTPPLNIQNSERQEISSARIFIIKYRLYFTEKI